MDDRSAWELEAENWVRFARAPGHDAYWYYRDSFFDEVLPPPRGVTLEVGSGEGRVTRDLVVRGHRVVSLDGAMTLLRHARELDPAGRYLRSDAAALAVRSGSVGIAVAYNSLMDFDDLRAAVRETARVLADGGWFCICITDPVEYSGGFDGDQVDARYLLRDDYFEARRFEETVVRNDITMTFRGWARPMQEYFSALFDAGLVVDLVREPVPSTREGRLERWHRVPMFLHIRAVKPRRPAAPATH